VIIFGDHAAVIEHSTRCNYMNEVDDDPITMSSDSQFSYPEAWKFAEVAFLINSSLSTDYSFPFGEKLAEFISGWECFIPQFWFAAQFLDNIYAGVAFAMYYLIRSLKGLNGTKKSVNRNFGRAMAYLFTFEPEKCDSTRSKTCNFLIVPIQFCFVKKVGKIL
jgi:hypothetical protein